MKNKLVCFLLGSLFISSVAYSQNPVGKYLSKLKILENKDGRKAEVYQDVIIRLNPFQERNQEYPIISESELPEKYIKKAEAQKYFKKLNAQPVISEDNLSFEDFMNDYFFLRNEDDSIQISEFPYDLQVSPELSKLYLCLNGNYRYISQFVEYPPDALSCHVCPALCDKKCRKNKKEKKIVTGYTIYGRRIRYIKEVDKRVHSFGPNNVYKEFKNTVLSRATIEDADDYSSDKNYIEFTFKDRVPPQIVNGFPNICEKDSLYSCTSNDYSLTEKFEIKDDIEPIVYAKFAFGKIDECPKNNEEWKNKENWNSTENIVKIDNNNETQYFNDVVRFREPFDGYLRYSIFAKEQDSSGEGNVNPGVASIKLKQPDIGYGYSEAGDLGNTTETARDWPDKRSLSDISEQGYNTGLIRVKDNDKPNIIIRVTNTETNEQMFFPPCFAANELKISNSSKYTADSGNNKTNQDDYNLFVENLDSSYSYKTISKGKDVNPYYTIYSINASDIKNKNRDFILDKLLLNKDSDFINENIRVEDYYFSDKDKNGVDITDNISSLQKGSLGKSCGTFSKIAVLFENSGKFQFKTGVEYKLDVWTDDNVKWSNVSREESNSEKTIKLLDKAQVYDTGIKSGFIKLNFYNDNLNQETSISPQKSINGNICFTLQNETNRNHDIKTVEDLEANGFPSITVFAEDFSGLTREVKLFFRVNDRKLNLKAMD